MGPSNEEIAEDDRFGAVVGDDGERLAASPVPLKARGRER